MSQSGPATNFMSEENFDDEDREEFYGLLNKIKNYLLDYYTPVQDPKDAEFHLSTSELHQQLLKIFPNELILTADLVASWMHAGGFTFYDFGEMKFEWLVKRSLE
jgi:hypothetical protein